MKKIQGEKSQQKAILLFSVNGISTVPGEGYREELLKTKVILIKSVLLKRKIFITRVLRESQRASRRCGSWGKLRGFINLEGEKMTFILLTSN